MARMPASRTLTRKPNSQTRPMAWKGKSFVPQPTWSASRDQQLQSCERKYYFQYHAGGRLNADDAWQREVGLLKKLKTVPMWQGECVHWAIAQCLGQWKSDARPDHASLQRSLQQKIDTDWAFSAARKFRTDPWLIDKAGVALLEHEYGEMPAEISAATVFAAASQSFARFLDWAEGAGALPEKIRMADRIWIEPQSFGAEAPGFMIDSVQVLTKVDFACERVGVSFDIYDWKTGAAPRSNTSFLTSNELQIAIYQLWPQRGMNVPVDQISSRLVYLGGDGVAERPFKLDDDNTAAVLFSIESSIRLARRWEEFFSSSSWRADDLSYAASPKTCKTCGFKGICRESLSLPS